MTALTEELKKEHLKYRDHYGNLNQHFINACRTGDFQSVKYLLTAKEFSGTVDIKAGGSAGFMWACKYGHFEIVKYLLTSSEIKENEKVQTNSYEGFIYACKNGCLDVIKYLLTSPDLKDHADIHVENDYVFKLACEGKHWSVVNYLLSFCDDQCIEFQKTDYNLDWAIENKCYDVVYGMMCNLYSHDKSIFDANIQKVMNYYLAESWEYFVIMSNTFNMNLENTSHCNEIPILC